MEWWIFSGVEAIYQFINHKVKKKFLFVNNLQNKYKNSKINSKCINIIISKSGYWDHYKFEYFNQ